MSVIQNSALEKIYKLNLAFVTLELWMDFPGKQWFSGMLSTNTEFELGSWTICDSLFVFQYISILCLITGTETICIICDTLMNFNFLVPEHLSSDAVGLYCRVTDMSARIVW
jgi:hypothetical protein